ncbi:hypothetical protein [Aminipila sp.]|uniref:hypothetical protein n=1 Tax=Aminipila sp. TaxID=2060095 RepID=UPI001E0B9F43|nr:hypothetical protein [Aminipila sp.]MBE6034586.1 hypothetical protein [Clostridiales bacterium]
MKNYQNQDMDKEGKPKYAELWGDRVVLKELLIASVIGIILTMAFYFNASRYFLSQEGIEPGLAKGYSLMIGIGGCLLGGIISSKLFKPKREVVESGEELDVLGAIEAAGSTLEDEIKAMGNTNKQSIEEMKALGLDALLELDKMKEEN